MGLALVGGLSAVMIPVRSDIARATPALALVVPIVFAALVGGRRVAEGQAAGASVGISAHRGR